MRSAKESEWGEERNDRQVKPGGEMKKILILHGVNLNMFGKRDPKYYGTFTLADVDRKLQELGRELGVEVVCFQTNCEGKMCERIHQAFEEKVDAVVINGAGWSHNNIPVRDALMILTSPIVEVHVANIQKREEFRHRSMISDIAEGYIAGFGIDSYRD
jgi:3-dehydroquinate dehydratase-2